MTTAAVMPTIVADSRAAPILSFRFFIPLLLLPPGGHRLLR
jgi:hypothetical protein